MTGTLRDALAAVLAEALTFVELVLILDNSSIEAPFRHVATWQRGRETYRSHSAPAWLPSGQPASPDRISGKPDAE